MYPPLGRIQVVVAQQSFHRELEHRDAPGDQIPDGGIAVLLAQLARIHPVGRHGDKRLTGDALFTLECLERGSLPCLVTVEGVDHLATEVAVVHHQSTQ